MIGVIGVGGGTRGIYGCGVLDRCMELGVTFDYAIGVSAGSANLASFLAGQKGRNYPFYYDYAFRPDYMGVRPLLKTGSLLGLDYIYGTLSNSDGENPLDFDALMRNPTPFEIVATDLTTGRPKYFTKQDLRQDDYAPLKASSCVPTVCRPYVIDGVPYIDGGISDPIPFRRAFEAGCDRAVVILTRPVRQLPGPGKTRFAYMTLRNQYPAAALTALAYPALYDRCMHEARLLEKQGKLLLIAPDTIHGMGTLTRDKESLDALYRRGLADAERISFFCK